MKRNFKKLWLLPLFFILTSLSTQTASAVSYRGFIDLGAGANFITGDYNVDSDIHPALSVSTTHGVQINKHLFVGCGLGYIYDYTNFHYKYNNEYNLYTDIEMEENQMPIYGCVRYDWNIANKISPFVSMKLGYCVNLWDYWLENEGNYHGNYGEHFTYFYTSKNPLYLSLALGFRVKLSSKVGLNFGIAYHPSWTKFNKSYNQVIISDEIYGVTNCTDEIEVREKNIAKNTSHSVMLNIGFDF